MRRMIFIMASVLACTSAFAAGSAEAQLKILREVSSVASVAWSTYQNEGMSGLQMLSQECWQDVDRQGFKCLRIDMAARHIDRRAGGGTAFPLNPYFGNQELAKRVWPFFDRNNADRNEASDYLVSLQTMMGQAVDHAITKQQK